MTLSRHLSFLTGFSVITLVCIAGCSPTTSIVSGSVKYKGTLVKKGTVTFVAQKANAAYAAEIKDDGSYEIKGVPFGPASVTVVQLPKDYVSPAEMRKKQMLEGDKKPGEVVIQEFRSLLPMKYAQLESTTLKFEISKKTEVIDLNLD